MLEYILIMLCLPPICAILCMIGKFSNGLLHWIHRLTTTAVCGAVAMMAYNFDPAKPFMNEYLYVDALIKNYDLSSSGKRTTKYDS